MAAKRVLYDPKRTYDTYIDILGDDTADPASEIDDEERFLYWFMFVQAM